MSNSPQPALTIEEDAASLASTEEEEYEDIQVSLCAGISFLLQYLSVIFKILLESSFAVFKCI